MLRSLTKTFTAISTIAVLMAPLMTPNAAYANSTTVPRKCINGVWGSVKYYGGKVRISLSSKLSRPPISIQRGSATHLTPEVGAMLAGSASISSSFERPACLRVFTKCYVRERSRLTLLRQSRRLSPRAL